MSFRIFATSLGTLLLVALVLWAPALSDASWFFVLSDAAHAVIFGCVALLALIALRPLRDRTNLKAYQHYGLAFAFTLLLGLLTEIVQVPLNRDASAQDYLKDIFGAWIVIAAYAVFDIRLGRMTRTLAGLTAILPGLIVSLPVIETSSAYLRKELRFPVIADFRHGYDNYFLRRQSSRLTHLPLPDKWSQAEDEQALQILFGSRGWPGLDFREVAHDWQDYSVLAVDITNPDDEALKLQLRVHDRIHNEEYSDRFNLELSIPAGERIVNRVPLALIEDGPRSRRLALDDISGLMLFVNGPENARRVIYLSGIWLE